MRIELENRNQQHNDEIPPQTDDLASLIKESSQEEKTRFSDLDGKKKAQFIWDYYRWWIIGGIISVVLLTVFIRDWRENAKPMYLYAEMLNTYFGADKSNTLYDDFVRASGVDLTKENLTIGTDTYLAVDSFDTTMIAYQERLYANYSAQAIDVVIGPRKIIEGPANCGAYADFSVILPQDLIDELEDKGYEFYYLDQAAINARQAEDGEDVGDEDEEDMEPYFAGVYLDNCSYLNNMGEAGAYPVAETEGDRPVFTIAVNSLRTDHAIEFLRFLIQ